MKAIANLVLVGALGLCAFNALYSILGALLLYAIIGAITQVVMAPFNYSRFLKALAKSENAEQILSDRGAINLGFAITFILGILLWPTHIINLVNTNEEIES